MKNEDVKNRCEFDGRIYYSPEMLIGNSFYQFPKWLMPNKEIKNDAKLLYMVILDHYKQSIENKWFDKQNRVYCYASKQSIANTLNIGLTKCYELFTELETSGFIEQIRQGQGKNNRIYLKSINIEKYYKDNENSSFGNDNKFDSQTSENRTCKHSDSDEYEIRNMNANNNITNKNNLINSTSANDLCNELNKSFNEKFELNGMVLNAKQIKDINSLVKMIETHQLKSSKEDLLKFLHKIYDENKQTFMANGKEIKSLFNFVVNVFDKRTKELNGQNEEIRKMAENGNQWAQDYIEKHPWEFE